MRHVVGTVFAIAVAGVAAVAATTAWINSPLRIGPPPSSTPTTTPPGQTPAPTDKPAPAGIPDAPPRGASAPATAPEAGPATAGAAKPGEEEEKDDTDPYEGVAPEELPPDLQYDADSNVSFPTNT